MTVNDWRKEMREMRDETERPRDDVPGGTDDYRDRAKEAPTQGGGEGPDETSDLGGDEGPSGWDGGGPGDTERPGDGGLGGY